MVKKLYFILIILVFSLFSAAKSPLATETPLSLGALLVEQPTLQNMVDLCEYYKLIAAPDEEEYTVYSSMDGKKFRFKNIEGKAIVEVFVKEKPSAVRKYFTEIGFYPEDGNKKSYTLVNNLRKCVISSNPTTLTFSIIERKRYSDLYNKK